jgi:hypothetical protein
LSDLGIPCAASRDSLPDADFKSGTDELRIGGIFVDEIREVSKFSNVMESLESYLLEVDRMVDSLGRYPTGEKLSDLKWKVPIADVELPEEIVSVPLDLHASYQALKKLLEQGSVGEIERMPSRQLHPAVPFQGQVAEDDAKQQCLLASLNYLSALQGELKGWKFVITAKGYVGVASNDPQIGDQLVIFSGAVVPFCLRSSTTRHAHRLVGDCYVHGIMLGEAWSPDKLVEIILH